MGAISWILIIAFPSWVMRHFDPTWRAQFEHEATRERKIASVAVRYVATPIACDLALGAVNPTPVTGWLVLVATGMIAGFGLYLSCRVRNAGRRRESEIELVHEAAAAGPEP